MENSKESAIVFLPDRHPMPYIFFLVITTSYQKEEMDPQPYLRRTREKTTGRRRHNFPTGSLQPNHK